MSCCSDVLFHITLYCTRHILSCQVILYYPVITYTVILCHAVIHYAIVQLYALTRVMSRHVYVVFLDTIILFHALMSCYVTCFNICIRICIVFYITRHPMSCIFCHVRLHTACHAFNYVAVVFYATSCLLTSRHVLTRTDM